MSHTEYTTADFISGIEEAIMEDKVLELGRKVLLRDMSDIVDKINEQYIGGPVNIYFPDFFKYRTAIISSGYVRTYYITGVIAIEEWTNEKGLSRRNDKPALIEYYENGKIQSEGWHLHGLQHRENNLPALVSYNNDGLIINEQYWVNGSRRNR